jgi:hypothetical protein
MLACACVWEGDRISSYKKETMPGFAKGRPCQKFGVSKWPPLFGFITNTETRAELPYMGSVIKDVV